MSTESSFKQNKNKAQILATLKSSIEAQINHDMDTFKAHAFWKTMLVNLDPVVLAEALANTLDKVKISITPH